MELTLNWLINESPLNDIKLLTCSHLLTTPITGVNIMDNPDTVQWTKPGELILTTGYVFIDNPPLQIKILKELKEAGCSGLCLKTKRFFSEFPGHMLKYAEEIELPLIELPYYHSLAQVSDEIQQQLFLIEFEEATAEQQLFNTLFNGYFQGKSLNEILQTFSDYIKSSVFIFNSPTQAPWYALCAADRANHLFHSPLTDLKLHKHNPKKNAIFLKGSLWISGKELSAALLPLSTPKYTLCIVNPNPESLPWNTINHVLKIIDFSRLNTNLYHTAVSNYYDSFFHYLMNPESFSETSVMQLCEYYGLPIPPQGICILIKGRKKEEDFQPQKVISLIKNNLQSLSITSSSYFIAYNQNYVCICLFPSMQKLFQKVREIISEILPAESQNYIVGVSRQSVQSLTDAFEESSFILSLNKYFPDENLFFFQDYLVFWQIFKMTDKEKQNIYQMTVQPLIEFDLQNHTNLADTLWMYFCCHSNSSLAANKLFIHRNTFLKRMDKIKAILNVSIDHPASLFSIYYGLCIYRTLN